MSLRNGRSKQARFQGENRRPGIAVILAILCAYFPRRRRDGEVMALLMVLYSLTRWPIESLRGDETAVCAGMTLSQNISVGLLLLGLIFWVQLSKRPAGRHVDSAELRERQGALAAPRPGGAGRLAAGVVPGRS